MIRLRMFLIFVGLSAYPALDPVLASQGQFTFFGTNEYSKAAVAVGLPFYVTFQYDDDLPLTGLLEMGRIWSGSSPSSAVVGELTYNFDTIKMSSNLQENGSTFYALAGYQSEHPDVSWHIQGFGGDQSSLSWLDQLKVTDLHRFERWSGGVSLNHNFVAVTPCGSLKAGGLPLPASNRCPIPANALAPTDTQLMAMSADAYDLNRVPQVDGFQRVSNGVLGDHSLGSTYAEAFVASGVAGGIDQIVIAVRGSTVQKDFLLRNGTFATGEATDAFLASAIDVAGLIASLHQRYPEAHFTLTGHSLGGALAQALGDVLNIKAVGFDAPGAKDVLDENSKSLLFSVVNHGSGGDVLSDDSQIYTIRYYGDVVSNLGISYGDVRTLVPPDPDLVEAIARANITLPGICITVCHDYNALLAALKSGVTAESGVPDPLSRFNGFSIGLVPELGAAKIVLQVVDPTRFFGIDPVGPGQYIRIDMLDSDVTANALLLPAFFTFNIYGSDGSDWNFIGRSSGFEVFDLPIFASYLISNASVLKGYDGSFVIGMRFANSGTFRGQLSTLNVASVPEPANWAAMIMGFVLVGAVSRRKSTLTRATPTPPPAPPPASPAARAPVRRAARPSAPPRGTSLPHA